MIRPAMPRFSASLPIRKPGVSAMKTSGTLKLSQSTMKFVILEQASASRAPPLKRGLEATMPTVRPSSLASPVTAARAKRSLRPKKLPGSTIASMAR